MYEGAKKPGELGWRLLMRALIYGILPMFGLLEWNKRNKYYKEINDTEKIDNWIVMYSEDDPDYWKIPKGHMIKLIVNPAQMFAEKLYGTSVGDASDIAWSIYETSTPLPGVSDVPPALKLFLEPIANYDYYWNQAIEKPAMKALPAGSRFNRTTSEALKTVGYALNISPIMLQHQMNTVFAGAGRNALFVIDLVTGKIKDPSIDRLPIIRRFTSRAEEWKSEIEQKLNEVNKRLREMERVSLKTLVKSYGYRKEDLDKALVVRKKEFAALMQKRKSLMAARNALDNIKPKE
jgi:hypothetical protein